VKVKQMKTLRQVLPQTILHDYLVLDLSSLITGPYCASLLGDFGADVIKVELPLQGDALRHLGKFSKNESILFLSINRNKKSITLDLSTPEGQEILSRMIARADVLIENFRPDMRKQYGLDYNRISQIKPDIIHLSITAFGDNGPYRLKPGTDHIFQGLGGIMGISGQPDMGPIRIGVPVADMTAALYAAFGVVSALLYRRNTSEGQMICINLLDSVMSLQTTLMTEYLMTGKDPVPCGNDSPFAYPVGVYRCFDSYLTISAYTNRFWRNLCKALELDTLADDPRFNSPKKRFSNKGDLKPILEERFASKKLSDWLTILEKYDVPCGPVHSYQTLFSDPQVINNELIRRLPHSGLHEIRTLGNPLRFSRAQTVENRGSPLLGEDTDKVLSALGYSYAKINELRNKNII
jgi:crotonobetainyl-CoA:carnitine CoA-transferase CaiB-like acyl-CoA transferase